MTLAESITHKEGWPIVRFGDVVHNVRETERDPLAAGIERFVGVGDIEPDDLHIRSWGLVADGTSFTRKFRKGQVLFAKRRAYQRKVAVASFDGVCSGDLLVFEPKGDRLLPDLLPFIVQSDGFYERAIRTSAGSLSPRTRWHDLAAYEFRFPPLDEQRRIAEILWAVDAELQEIKACCQCLLKLSRAYAIESLGDSSLSSMPLGSWVARGDVELQTGPFGTVLKASQYSDSGTPLVNPSNIVDGEIDSAEGPYLDDEECERLSQYRARRGDILLGRKGDVGRAAYVTDEYDGYIIGSDIIRIRSTATNLDSQYLFCYVRSDEASSWLLRHASGTTMPGINERILSRLPVPLLPYERQQEVVEVYEHFRDVQRSLDSQTARNDDLRRALSRELIG